MSHIWLGVRVALKNQSSEIYYAYHFIHRYVEEPFTNIPQETLLYSSRFLWAKLQNKLTLPGIILQWGSSSRWSFYPNSAWGSIKTMTPGKTHYTLELLSKLRAKIRILGVSKVYVLYAFAKISRQLECYKTARYCYNQLRNLKIPRGPIWETIQIGSVSIRGKPYRDQDDFNIVCPRCATANPLVSSESLDGCGNCQQEYVYSFSNFEPLPLVEFKFEDDLTDQEAYGLIDTAGFQKEKSDSIQTGGSYERMDFSSSGLDNNMTFEKLLVQSDGEIILSREMLRNLSHSEVLVRKYEKPKRNGLCSVVIRAPYPSRPTDPWKETR